VRQPKTAMSATGLRHHRSNIVCLHCYSGLQSIVTTVFVTEDPRRVRGRTRLDALASVSRRSSRTRFRELIQQKSIPLTASPSPALGEGSRCATCSRIRPTHRCVPTICNPHQARRESIRWATLDISSRGVSRWCHQIRRSLKERSSTLPSGGCSGCS
jgi:hypothetical protein